MEKLILLDASGSMAEEGKDSVVRYALYAAESLLREAWPEVPYSVYLWNEKIAAYGGKKITFAGRTDAGLLAEFLGRHPDADVLLVGDGNYEDDVEKAFRRADARALVLLVGGDANRQRAGKIAGSEHVYEATDVATCVWEFAGGGMTV